jgi:hypothetical protein
VKKKTRRHNVHLCRKKSRTEKFTELSEEKNQRARSNFRKNLKFKTAELRKTTDSKKIT